MQGLETMASITPVIDKNMPTLPEMVQAFESLAKESKNFPKLEPRLEEMAKLLCLKCIDVRVTTESECSVSVKSLMNCADIPKHEWNYRNRV